MRLESIDWIILGLSVAVCFVPPFFLARRAGRSVAEFFTSGQSAPWWLIGLSMVATTFSTDTPNLVTDIVRCGQHLLCGDSRVVGCAGD
jgi:solute:Na+ symporter, SSS family